jgi:transposase
MKSLKKRDFRSLSEETQAELRRLAFRKIDQGWTQGKVAEMIEVSVETINRWVTSRKEIEARHCKGMKRGRVLYEQRILSQEQELTIKQNIENKIPEQLGLPYALWNRKAIQHCIQQETGKKVWLQTASKYAQRWGLTPQRPAKYAYEQNPEKIQEWLHVEYPKIIAESKENDAEIHWEDETGVAISTFYARSYAPSGKTPAIKLPAKQGHLSIISSVTNRGDLRFMMYKGALDTHLFILFMERLIKDTRKKVYLIVDNLRVHKAKQVQAWEKKHTHLIKIFFLPPYAPQYNPDELMHNTLKQNIHRSSLSTTYAELKKNVYAHLMSLQKKPAVIRSFFSAPLTKYAK